MVNFLAKRRELYIAIGALIHNNAIVKDDNADPQPAVSGYIEFAGEIVKISSVEDIKRVLERLRG